jgi:hypothetical protein
MLFGMCFAPDGGRVLTACRDGQASQWDWQSADVVCSAGRHSVNEMGVDDLCTFAALTAGQRVCEGGLARLTSDEWLSRWRTFRKRKAQLEKVVEVLKGEIKCNGHWLMPPGGRRT